MTKEIPDKLEKAQLVKTNRVVNRKQRKDRRIQEALEDDEVREALVQLHAGKGG